MASNKKQSEGIALLSIYADDEDDDMEDVIASPSPVRPQQLPKSPLEQPVQQPPTPQTLISPENNNYFNQVTSVSITVVEETALQIDNELEVQNDQFDLSNINPVPSPSIPVSFTSPPLTDRSSKLRLSIVDYAHDEMAMSPEPEEGEILVTGRVTYGEELQVTTGELRERKSPQTVQSPSSNMRASPPQSADRNDLQEPNEIVGESGPVGSDEDIILTSEERKEVDPLDKFLPPPPKEKCSEELQIRFEKFLNLKKNGKSYNAEVRKKKEYRNPDFLLHAVTYQDIDQIGSCFIKDVFDPHGYDKSDFYDALEMDMRREMERKEQERKKSPKVEFVSGGSQQGTVIPTPKLNLPIQAANLPPAAADGGRDGRANKKSKWDKVEGDSKNHLVTGGKDAISAALLSAANAGSGYSAFGHQRRREGEDKRSERKLDKRS